MTDKTFKDAAKQAVSEPRSDAKIYENTARLGGMVGAYYIGLVSAGVPTEQAMELTRVYQAFAMEQVQISADATRAVIKGIAE